MGASRRFSPLHAASPEAAQEGLRHLVHSSPHEFRQLLTRPTSRWTLAGLRDVLLWVSHYSLSGIWRLLQGFALHWKRGRDHVRSPDPDYHAKLAYLATCQAAVEQDPRRRVLLFQDELTYYRQPTLASSFAPSGSKEPLAERSHRSNTPTRLTGALNARTGQVSVLQAPRIGVPELVRFYEHLAHQYAAAERIYLVQDNWPVHFHPDVLAALEPQEWPWPWLRPGNWSTAPSASARRLHLPIQLVPLPTYASWANPIEKLWRWLRQDLLHLHPWADDLAELRRQVLAFLDQFAQGSSDLLRYVGLLTPG